MAVTVEEAFEKIYASVAHKLPQTLPIEDALGYVLAEDIFATHNLPPYDNSAMDGYAIKISDTQKEVRVTATILAGDRAELKLGDGEAIKIMTGAKLPQGCDLVLPIEDVVLQGETFLVPQNIELKRHVRVCGEDIAIGDCILSCGERLFAHHITLLASQGITHIQVYAKPRVAVFGSGSELIPHYEKLQSHQLYNSNTPTFVARCHELGAHAQPLSSAVDTIEAIQKQITASLSYDLILTSGGVSVGDADFTKEAFLKLGFTPIFEKIEIKPGKPTTFGRIGSTYVLNLPGNPLAAALNFELFGAAIILALSGTSAKYLAPLTAKLGADFKHKGGKKSLIPGIFDGEFFTPLKEFAPGMIRPLSTANSYILVDESIHSLKQNHSLKILSTRFGFYSKTPKELTTH